MRDKGWNVGDVVTFSGLKGFPEYNGDHLVTKVEGGARYLKPIEKKGEAMLSHKDYIIAAQNNLNFCIDIMIAKSKDYAKDYDPFANFRACEQFGVKLEKGILIRLSDKMSRIGNLLDKEADVKDESIHDTIRDAINYFNILGIYLTEKARGKKLCQLKKEKRSLKQIVKRLLNCWRP